MARDLLGTLAQWRDAHGDAIHLRIWPEHQVVLTHPDLVRELLVGQHDALTRWEHGISVFAQLHGHSVLVSEGHPWRAKRQALLPAFSPRTVQSQIPALTATAEASLQGWPGQSHDFPMEQALTTLTMDVIMRLVFSGAMGEDARAAGQAIREVSHATNREFYWPLRWPDFMPWKRGKRQALAWLRGFIDQQLRARLAQKPANWPEDLLSRLLRLHQDDTRTWTLQAVRDECMTAFLAGHETVASSLTWWSWCMASHPEAQETVAEEVRERLQGRPPTAQDLPALRQLDFSLREAMRLYPAAPVLISRRCTRPVQLGPWRLPAGTMFMIAPGLMQRDARWFPEPHAFRPARFDEAHPDGAPTAPRGSWMPFGTGPRICLGQHLAQAEMAVVAAMLLQRWHLHATQGASAPRPVLQVTLRPQEPLRLRLEPRAHAKNPG
ncbi:cytochrome P450 [Delftia tsuruhatensis]|uniref:cytochrome P450 n=1 Tax=Delftia tsuruhatensis TaxID=180282 RepID=UPI001E6D6EBD|nr:cytochrome P450 [Delftia tsuruhatensis]CAC9684851.1 Putative cytochrome P450 120 [Delftia tsuruhatensis]